MVRCVKHLMKFPFIHSTFFDSFITSTKLSSIGTMFLRRHLHKFGASSTRHIIALFSTLFILDFIQIRLTSGVCVCHFARYFSIESYLTAMIVTCV